MLVPAPPQPVSDTRRRLRLLLLALLTVLLGLGSRTYGAYLPTWLAAYAGDTLWALLVFWLVAFLRPRWPVAPVGIVAAILALAVEISQLYQTSWLNTLRRTTIGGLVLGHGFLWSDLLCYAAGIALGCALEWGWRRSVVRMLKTVRPQARNYEMDPTAQPFCER